MYYNFSAWPNKKKKNMRTQVSKIAFFECYKQEKEELVFCLSIYRAGKPTPKIPIYKESVFILHFWYCKMLYNKKLMDAMSGFTQFQKILFLGLEEF